MNEGSFRALIERSSELVCVLDEHGVIEYANPACFGTLGRRPGDILGRLVFELADPDDGARLAAAFTEVARTSHAVVAGEYTIRRHDGTRRVLAGVVRNLLSDDVVRSIVVSARDVTERRRAERALEESEARYRHIAGNMPGMVYQYVYRPDGSQGYTFVSEGARTLFGVAPEAALNDAAVLLDLIHPDDRPGFRALAAAVATTGGPFSWEGRVLLPSGEERRVQIAARDERLADGTIVSDGLVTDVTELRSAARRLEERERQFRSLFDYNPDAVFSLDSDGCFISANPACEALSGYAPDELLGRSFEPLIVEEDLERVRMNFAMAVGGQATRYEAAIWHRSRRRVQLGVTNVPMIVDGRSVGVFGIAKDLTAQRLLESQLRQAQKMEAVGRLAGGIAHDFNNLLTVIMSYTALAAGEVTAGGGVASHLQAVRAAADRAAALTRQLLAFSRQQMLKARELDPNRTVLDVAGMLQRVIGEDVKLETALSPDAWPVHADPGQLEQVLMNLTVNARDAMPNGGTLRLATANVSIDAAAARERPGLVPGDFVALLVEDTGTGIDPSVFPHLFEPFFTTKELGKGTGLGLATVYGIVKQSGGYVYADSSPGAGSRFTVLLPRMHTGTPEAPVPLPAAAPRGTETILLVEDDPPVRDVVRETLRSLGYSVLDAESGDEALRVAVNASARGARIDLVLTDVVMPEMSGRVLGQHLADRWPDVKIVYMSGYTDDEILRRGLMQSGISFLEKPFTPAVLAEALRRVLDEQPISR